jgi:tRNA(Leu) C34 or U34 (ribose-2'-O)-methylase TrmL
VNVIDYYKDWEAQAILADLNTKRNDFTVIASNLENDFNIATLIRNANAFMAAEVWIYGRKQYDRRGTVGTHHYTNFKHVKTIDSVHDALNQLRIQHEGNINIVGMDNIPGAKDITNYEWDCDMHTVMVFGQEKNGIPTELLSVCDDVVYIPQYGSVRSLNVGTASGIAMYAYCSNLVSM